MRCDGDAINVESKRAFTMMMEDDEFSSDSDASSVDISLLVGDSVKPSAMKMAPVADVYSFRRRTSMGIRREKQRHLRLIQRQK